MRTLAFLATALLQLIVVSGRVVAAENAAVEPEWLPVQKLIVDAVTSDLMFHKRGDVALRIPTPSQCVSVRGVYPLDDQLRLLADNLRCEKTKAAELFELLDFDLERQSLPTNHGNAAEPKWEDVSIQTALDVLRAVDYSSQDVVPAKQSDPVITMLLPKRRGEDWPHEVITHPNLDQDKKTHLLFRFLDFSVQPGHVYRYRVKLIVKNPNFQKESAGPFLMRGATREASWSQPSPAVSVNKVTKKE